MGEDGKEKIQGQARSQSANKVGANEEAKRRNERGSGKIRL